MECEACGTPSPDGLELCGRCRRLTPAQLVAETMDRLLARVARR